MRSYLYLTAMLLLSVGRPAWADTIRVTGPGTDDIIELPGTPRISASGSYGFRIDQVAISESGVNVSRNIVFFSEAIGGGLLILKDGAEGGVNAFGSVLYSGTNDSPIFRVGAYTLLGSGTYTVTIEDVATPEPASFALVGMAILASTALIKRRIEAASKFH